MSAPDPSSNYQKALEIRHTGTGTWFVKREEFATWKTKSSSFLWLYGKPGSGKSVLAATINENIMDQCRLEPSTAVLFFCFDFADNEKQHHESMIRSFIIQLFTLNTHSFQALKSLRSSYGLGQPSFNALLSLLREMIEHFQETFIIVDALDECKERENLLTILKKIADWKLAALHILVTSRKENDIEESMNMLSDEKLRICLEGVQANDDICAYIHDRLQTDQNLKRWQKNAEVQQEIEETLISKANGM